MQNSQHELQLVQQGENILYDARLLHKELKSKRQFADWVKDKIINTLFKNGQDYFSQKSDKLSVGRKGIDYMLTVDTAKHIAMMENNEVGYAIRCKFIAKEKELRGISQLPKEAALFVGIKSTTINGRKMYPYKQVRIKCGYSTKGSSANHKNRYPQHFVLQGNVLLTTQEFCLHLYHQKQVVNNRATLQAMQPVLPFNFGEPLKLKGGTHA